MTTLKELQAAIKKRNDELDGISDSLVVLLKEYQQRYESELRKVPFNLKPDGRLKRTSANFTKASAMNMMKKLGYNTLSVGYIKEYPGVAKEQMLFNKRLGIDFNLTFNDVSIVKHYQNVDLGEMFLKGQELDAIIKRELVNAIALESPFQDAVDNIAESQLGSGKKAGQIANWADSQLRTSLYGLTRTIDKEIYDSIGEDKFIYAGALDKRTRPFCATRVGERFTTEEIQKFGEENGSFLDGFMSPGGFRCRHSLIGVSALD